MYPFNELYTIFFLFRVFPPISNVAGMIIFLGGAMDVHGFRMLNVVLCLIFVMPQGIVKGKKGMLCPKAC
jgi:hypothetical protein